MKTLMLYDDDPAPAYTPPGPDIKLTMAPMDAQQFPRQFSLYSSGGLSSLYMLGEQQDRPLYAVTTNSGGTGKPDVVLHSGTAITGPVLASAHLTSFSSDMTIALAWVSPEEQVISHGWKSRVYGYSVGRVNGSDRRDAFEWRHSQGDEVKELGGRPSGWKLVRLSGSSNKTEAYGPTSSDGKEIVAVFAEAMTPMPTAFHFSFVGSAAAGSLREREALMAVMTALGIWEREKRRRKRTTSANDSGSGDGGSA